jgi:hypothetical protein
MPFNGYELIFFALLAILKRLIILCYCCVKIKRWDSSPSLDAAVTA